MTNFEAAVKLSLNNWVDSFPTEFDLPEPTEEYKKNIAKLMDKMRGDRYHKLTLNTARAILIAAIIMAIATVTLAATVGKDFIVQKFKDHSTYSVVNVSDVKNVGDIEIGYIPEGFENNKNISNESFQLLSFSDNTHWINVWKKRMTYELTYETEHKTEEYIKINEYKGIYYENSNSHYSGIIWNDGKFIYTIEGDIAKEELIKIAENIT